jgi:N-acetylated-alpha-linked acidic dipeptidase
VNGAEDPISGLVPELEEARALGALYKQGWRPKRTIIYAAWDGEEPALLGSTEWVEEHMTELRQKGVFYLNTDGNGRGYFGVEGSHSLERFANEVGNEIQDPESNVSVSQRARSARVVGGDSKARDRKDLRIGALGSGSDFTPFLQHAGVPTLNIGFGGEDGGGIYHSIYDSFYWYTHFSDTSFVYGRALAQAAGTMIMRVASADVLPEEFGNMSETSRGYLAEVKTLREKVAKDIDELNQQIAEGAYRVTNDPHNPLKEPKSEAPAVALNFAPLENASDELDRAAAKFEKAYAGVAAGTASAASLAQVNALLRQSDQALLIPEGLPKRPWYQHSLYAPGLYTGYGVKTMPGVREAIEQKDWKQADEQIVKVAAAIMRESELVTKAAVLLEQATNVKPVP